MSTRLAVCGLAPLFAATTLLFAGAANAQPNEKALRSIQGTFKFGMTIRQVCKILERRINRKYTDKIAATTDPFKQDKLRAKAQREYKRIAASFVRFGGKAKGWDVSIIDKEFWQKTGESMLVYWDNLNNKNNRRFFFFFRGRLYKTLTALDVSNLPANQRQFAIIQRVLQKRFGKGKVGFTTHGGIKEASHLDWYAKGLWVRASDKMRFYKTFTIAAIDRRIWKKIVVERAKHMTKKQRSNILKSMVDPSGEKPGLDEYGHVIRDITKPK